METRRVDFDPTLPRQYGLGLLIPFGVAFLVAILPPVSGQLTGVAFLSLLALPATYTGLKNLAASPLIKLTACFMIVIMVSGFIHSAARTSTWFTAIYPAAILGAALLFMRIGGTKPENYIRIAYGVGLGLILLYIVRPSAGDAIGWLKSGGGVALAILLFAVFTATKSSRYIVACVTLLVSGALLLLDARNQASIVAVAGCLPLAFGAKYTVVRISTVLKVIFLSGTLAIAIIWSYSTAATAGLLGADAEAKYERQSSIEGGILVGGRPEIIASIVAIESDPLVGRGGSPRMEYSERLDAISRMEKAGIAPSPVGIQRIIGRTINSHSLIFESWVAHGVLGAGFWIGLLVWLWWSAISSLANQSPLRLLVLLGAAQLSWDFAFSPWNPGNEAIIGLFCAVAIVSRSFGSAKRKPAHVEPAGSGVR